LAIDIDRIFFTDNWSRLPGVLNEFFESPGCAEGNWLELAMPFAPAEKMAAHFERRIECDPLFLLSYTFLTELYLREGDLDRAEETLAGARRFPGNGSWLNLAEVQLVLKRGQMQAELQALEAGPGESLSSRQMRNKVRFLSAMGRVDEALEAWEGVRNMGANTLSGEVVSNAIMGDRVGANAIAARLDAEPAGSAELARTVNACACGAPWDLSATPNFAARLQEAGWDWPPETLFDYPAKDW
jgi:hypothetical protein